MNKCLRLLNFSLLLPLLVNCNLGGGLGNHLVLLEGDRLEDRIIVYCTSKSTTICSAGTYLLPKKYENHMDSQGHYNEYVEKAKSNEKWVIAKSIKIKGNVERYWFINKEFNIENLDCNKSKCDSILQSHVIGPLTYQAFKLKDKELGINLSFD